MHRLLSCSRTVRCAPASARRTTSRSSTRARAPPSSRTSAASCSRAAPRASSPPTVAGHSTRRPAAPHAAAPTSHPMVRSGQTWTPRASRSARASKFHMLAVSRLNQNGVGAHMPAEGPAYLATRDGARIHLVRAGGLFALITRPRLHSTAIAHSSALGDPHSPYAHRGLALPWLSAVLALGITATPRLASGLAPPATATFPLHAPFGPHPPATAVAAPLPATAASRPPGTAALPAFQLYPVS
mmetsp:Transcript_3782/g.11190  ORF Transcript_3782/g.11190 Transcript_3782/m.11190 type:complete len:243 (-) Transcript_3782:64-792(-)